MKKLFSLFLFVTAGIISNAQTATFLVTTAPCHDDGVLTATFTGLTPPLTVRWYTRGTFGTTILHTGVAGLSDALTSYSGGPVSVAAHDALGGVDSGNYFVGMPPFDSVNTNMLPGVCPTLDTLTAHVVTGGTAPFTYQWYNVATSAIVGSGSPIFLTDGTYGVNITDAAGCTYGSRVSDILVSAVSFPSYVDSISATIANCTDGTATITPYLGGVPPFTYLWSNGATTNTITALTMGNYSVTIHDAIGCADTKSVYVPQSILITAPVVATPTTCLGSIGAVSAFGSGGVPPYSYVWSNGVTSQSQTGLGAGNYTVSVTDANGCIGTDGALVGTATPIAITYTTTPSLCTAPTGTATIAATGGTGAYTIEWMTTPMQTGATAINLTYGIYTVNVTDGVGCTQTGSVYIPPVDIITANFSSTPALCTLANGNITVYPTGGVAPYSYSWNTGATTSGLSSKPAGFYTVTITDVMGCKVTKVGDLPSFSPVNVGLTTTPTTCIFANDGVDSAVVWGGTPPYSYGWSSGGTTSTIASLPTGPYWLSVTDAVGCTSPNNYSYVGYDPAGVDCYCTIEGTVYQDTNGNCLQDAGELGIPNIQVYVSGRGFTYTDVSGHYSMKVPSGTYTVAETILAYYPLSACQINNITVIAAAGAGCVHPVDFANLVSPIHDIHISTWDYDSVRPQPGHIYNQVVLVSNDGSVTEDSIAFSYRPDGQIYAPVAAPAGFLSGTPYWYNNTGADSALLLNPGATKRFNMFYSVPTNIPMGTSLVFKDSVSYIAPMDNFAIDYSPWNNVNYFTTQTVASFDPNFKEVSPTGTGPAGIIGYADSVLEYMVHFQNTGSASAENVTVIDTLDDNFNWTSMRPEYMSAPCQVTLIQLGTKKVAKFTFSDINLPAKMHDEVRSNGMLTYTVHTKTGLPTGTQFRNHASIYFDYNSPVVTNSTLNTLGSVLPPSVVQNVPSVPAGSFNIFPNPASQSFSAVISAGADGAAIMNITDVTGKILTSKTLALQKGAQTIHVDASQLASGVYFVTLDQNGIQQTQKLVIVR